IILVGRQSELEKSLVGLVYPEKRVEIRHAEDIIQCDDDPGLTIRRKTNSSMVTAMQMVRSGEADAILSAGNTGALMAGGLLFLGRLNGISRPALLTLMPSFRGKSVLFLDVGANMDAKPEQLLQYAFMSRIYAQQILGCSEPRIALLNVGVEPNKGNSRMRKAFTLFDEHVPGFCGNVEGTDIFFGAADIVVCDGFVGNILLKTAEGLSRAILGYFKQGISTKVSYKLGALLLKPVFHDLRDKVDDSGYGGALLLGVNGLCIKCHGSSKARSIEQALLIQAYPFVKKDVIKQLQEALHDISECWT
ncbi:MAG TPA: phosphate acyltransferase PlsX, partial [Candidatus Limnocylindrales bacterium]|nr:phosphate acyltransferase PlsX [Candidatus Limnocylindrales bacterium]